ncbi:glycosyltransferase [Rubrobacter tropicus]|uniref:Glycosyltransferase n=1 Tax=Rubrobacter tropicus TaxID=2653851 RepID=A0A6G8Q7S1_9ACTN|nr:glycosyltransferase family 4 protein [Rubrobacter tropicus]QIN82534.1 glycosyltransferase [Rubrobacter tropicus]
MTHGYMLSGTGSNIYVQNLCRALVRAGHEVHLLCQDEGPLAHDFVNAHAAVDENGIEKLGEQETPYPGRCVVYNPRIGDLLPVYVYDDYPGWRVKTFLDLTDEELENYLARNAETVGVVLRASGAGAVITNHSVPGPLISRQALDGSGVPYASVVHGSCLQYVSRRSEKYMDLTREGLEGAVEILALSTHSAGTIAEDFPHLAGKTRSLPGGVDTDLFRPDALDLDILESLGGGRGRGPGQQRALEERLDRSEDAEDLVRGLKEIAGSYDARAHDSDAGDRLAPLLTSDAPVIVYLGKLIHSKGVHSLISSFAPVHEETGARLLLIGFGTFREVLQALVRALDEGDEENVRRLAERGRLLEGGPANPLEHFDHSGALLREAGGFGESVEFVGPLGHAELARVLPAADVAMVPSIFPETFGLVAAEFAAAGVVPFVADHSGLREAGAFVGQGLPFDLRVPVKDFEKNLSAALLDFLSRPEEERRDHSNTVRRNTVQSLSWGTLAEKIVEVFD